MTYPFRSDNVRHYVFYRFYRLRYALALESATPPVENVADRTLARIRDEKTARWTSRRDIVEAVTRETSQTRGNSDVTGDGTCVQNISRPHVVSLDRKLHD